MCEETTKFKRDSSKEKGMLQKIRKLDIFGFQVQWTVDGDRKYRTNIGSLLTLVFCTVMLGYGAKKFVGMYL